MNGALAGVVSALLRLLQRRLRGPGAAALGDEGGELRVGFGACRGERVVGGDGAETGAEQGVGAGREDLQPVGAPGDAEADNGPLRPADPVRLHGAHRLRPAFEAGERVEQVVGEVGDAEHPLRQAAPLHLRPRPPALAVDHLFVGEHRPVDRVPVHLRLGAVGHAAVEQIEKHGLLVAVVAGRAGGDFAAPVIGQAHGPQLAAHDGDVVPRPLRRMRALGHGGVLGRHAEGIPSHRVQHVEPARPLVARDHVADRIDADVAHMDAPGRIREHLQHVVFGARVAGFAGAEAARLLPRRLPLGLGGARVVPGLGGHAAPHSPPRPGG